MTSGFNGNKAAIVSAHRDLSMRAEYSHTFQIPATLYTSLFEGFNLPQIPLCSDNVSLGLEQDGNLGRVG